MSRIKIRLKDLNRLETEIKAELDVKRNSISYSGGYFASREAGLQDYAETIPAAHEKVRRLMKAYYSVRNSKAEAKAALGINERTAQIAELEDVINLLQRSVDSSSSPTTNYTSRTGDAVTWKRGCTSEYKDDIRVELRALRRRVQSLKDSCAGINANNEVELTQETSETLVAFRLVEVK